MAVLLAEFDGAVSQPEVSHSAELLAAEPLAAVLSLINKEITVIQNY